MFLPVLVFLAFIFTSSTSLATDYIFSGGLAQPFKSNRGHVTTDTGLSVDATQYFASTDWGAIGLREALWTFPTLGGYSVGIGPAGELRFPIEETVTAFVDASGSVGYTTLDTSRVPEISGTLQFSGQIGVGIEFQTGLRLELRYQHLSNGFTSYPNLGLDMITPMVGYRF